MTAQDAESVAERDMLAEALLLTLHSSPEWYIGDATKKEWEWAYAAADAALKERTDDQ